MEPRSNGVKSLGHWLGGLGILFIGVVVLACACRAWPSAGGGGNVSTTQIQPVSQTPPDEDGRKSFDIVLNGEKEYWTEYPSILLKPGDKVTFDATGKLFWDPAVPGEVGPEGAGWTPSGGAGGPHQFLLPDFPIVGLIGKIGDNIFGIGKHAEITVTDRGTLHLGINERWVPGSWNDNKGAFKVRVSVEQGRLKPGVIRL